MTKQEAIEDCLDNMYTVKISGAKVTNQTTIEVTFIDNGSRVIMLGKEFFEYFGQLEGREILEGYAPHIVAVPV